MKAVRIHEFGGPEVLKYEDVPDPELRKDYVLVRIRACALNHLDLWVRKGLPGVKLPHILGSDIAGEVAECWRVHHGPEAWHAGVAVAHAVLRALRAVQQRAAEFLSTVCGAGQ